MLSDDEEIALARLGMQVEAHYGGPRTSSGRSRTARRSSCSRGRSPRSAPLRRRADAPPATGRLLVRGLAASTGVGERPRCGCCVSPKEGSQLAAGEVLVAPMTNPDWVPTIRRAAAVVTDGGGMTCHAAIVTRELGVPCVVGARTRHLDAARRRPGHRRRRRGRGLRGRAAVATASADRPPSRSSAGRRGASSRWRRGIYVNLAIADHAEEVAAQPVDGVGLLRAEFMVTDALGGVHPRELLARGGTGRVPRPRCPTSLLRITRAFAPRPVVYRTIDFRTNEFRGLEGGDRFEPVEDNPMIGYRGCYRYIREPDLFALELELLARVRDETPNLHLMIPFVRTRWELEACLEAIDASPLGRQRGLHRWVMAEVPSVVYRIPEYAAMGIDGVSIGSNDLTQLMLGVDRDSEICAELFDESDAAVLDAIGRIITACRDAGHHLVALRPGAVEQAGVRRAPRALRHRLDLGRPQTPSTGPVPWWPPPSDGCCSMLPAGPDEEPVAWATIHKPASPASRSCTSPPRARRHPAGHGPEPPHCPSMGEPPAVPCDT